MDVDTSDEWRTLEVGYQSGQRFGGDFTKFTQTSRGRVAVEFTRGHIQHELFPFIGRQLHVRQTGAPQAALSGNCDSSA
jgi:hypothetical protein